MSPLWYLMRKQVKNALMNLLHHPGRLILYIGVIGLLIFALVVRAANPQESDVMDPRLLEGLYWLFLLVMGGTVVYTASKGSGLFTLPDVQFLFVSPLSSKKILIYAMLKQMGMTLLISVFFIGYSPMLQTMFGVSGGQVVVLIVGVAVILFLAQVLALLLYIFAGHDQKRMRTVWTVVAVVLGAVGAYLLYAFSQSGISLETAAVLSQSPVLEWLPIVGWIKAMAFGVMTADWLKVAIYAALTALTVTAGILVFLRSRSDYYEDVLDSAKTTYELQKAKQSGNTSAQSDFGFKNRKVRVGKTGLNGGHGASAFFYKHLLEMRRHSRIPMMGSSTLAMLVLGVVGGLFCATLLQQGEISANMALAGMTAFGVYILFFFSALGEWSRELQKPYIYLIPASPLQKLLWASGTTLLRPVLDGLLLVGAGSLILQPSPLTVLLCYLLYLSVAWLFTGSNILCERLLGSIGNRGLMMVAYLLLLGVAEVPAVAAAVTMYICGVHPGTLMALPVIGWNLLLTFLCYVLCRHTLHNMETAA